MTLYVTGRTNISDAEFLSITVEKGGKVMRLDWDETDISKEDDGRFSARFKGVYIDDEYANGRLDELKGGRVVDVEVDSELEENENEFLIFYTMEIDDGEEKYKIQKPYKKGQIQ